jgi:hypothetical protein
MASFFVRGLTPVMPHDRTHSFIDNTAVCADDIVATERERESQLVSDGKLERSYSMLGSVFYTVLSCD